MSNLWSNNEVILLLVFIVSVGLLSGAYPAFYLSAFKPHDIFVKTRSKDKQFLRKGLSIFRFTMSISLIAGSIIVYQ